MHDLARSWLSDYNNKNNPINQIIFIFTKYSFPCYQELKSIPCHGLKGLCTSPDHRQNSVLFLGSVFLFLENSTAPTSGPLHVLLPLSEFSSLRSSSGWLPLMTQVLCKMLLPLTSLSFFFFKFFFFFFLNLLLTCLFGCASS